MEIFLIALYFIIGFALAVAWCYYNPDELGIATGLAMVWPLVLAFMFFAFAPSAVAEFIRTRVNHDG